MGILANAEIMRATDETGGPVAGAQRYVYVSNSETLCPLYLDENLTISRANPMISDSDGWFKTCHVMEGIYRVVIFTASGEQLAEFNDIEVEISQTGTQGGSRSFDTTALLIEDTVLSYAAGEGLTTVQEGDIASAKAGSHSYRIVAEGATDYHLMSQGGVKFQVLANNGGFHVDAFGAVGDGSTDDTAAIQTAISVAQSDTCPVLQVRFSSEKSYFVTDQLNVDKTIHINGCGARLTTEMDNPAKAVLRLGQTTTKTYRHLIENITISHPIGTSQSSGVLLSNSLLTTLRRVYVSQFTTQIKMNGGATDPFIGWLRIEDCYLQGGDYGILGTGVAVNVTAIRECRFLQHAKQAIRFDNVTSLNIEGNDFSLCQEGAARIDGAGAVRIQGNYTETCGPGVEGSLSELFTFNNSHDIIIDGANHFGGAFGTWRSRQHVRMGLAFYGCSDVMVERNAFTYFMEAPVYFDASTGHGCAVRENSYATNFSAPIGFPVIDASGKVDVDGTRPPEKPKGTFKYIENLITAPREIANNWTHGAQVSAQRNYVTSTPDCDAANLADRLTFTSGGADKESSHTSIAVIGSADKEFALRFWTKLESNVATAPLSGIASLQFRIFDSATLLSTKHVNLSKHWAFNEIRFKDSNATPHPLTISVRPSDTVHMEFAYAMIGVQLADFSAPYIYPRYSAPEAYSREVDASAEIYPKVIIRDHYARTEDIANAAPTSGDWLRGDRVWNLSPQSGGPIGWVCVTNGSPGVWKEFAAVAT